jgi:hypothetical protein
MYHVECDEPAVELALGAIAAPSTERIDASWVLPPIVF